MPYSFAFVMALACCGFYYQAGKQEMDSGFLWAGLSLIVSVTTLLVFHGGVLAVLLGQVALLIGIAVFRAWRDPD